MNPTILPSQIIEETFSVILRVDTHKYPSTAPAMTAENREISMQNLAHINQSDALRFFSIDDMKKAGAYLDIGEVHAAVKEAWRDIRLGVTYGGKAVLSIPESEMWVGAEFKKYRQEFADERLGWKLSSLYSVNPKYGAVKIIGANAFNRRLGLPRSTSTILLLDKFTLLPLCVLDGTEISAFRTGTYATTAVEMFLRKKRGISVFVFGAGPVAQRVIESLNYSSRHIVSEIFVRSRNFDSAARLVAKLSPKSSISLKAVSDNTTLHECDFVVTASNAKDPVFDDAEIKSDAVVLHLGGNEAPEAYLQRVIKTGQVFCDDVTAVSRRNSQSLALFFSKKGSCLETVGPMLGITNLSDVADDFERPSNQPIHIDCVGLPVFDLYVTQHIYENYLHKTKIQPAA